MPPACTASRSDTGGRDDTPPYDDIERWAAGIPVPAYAIDDQTAIQVVEGTIEVVSEGHWRLFTPSPEASESG